LAGGLVAWQYWPEDQGAPLPFAGSEVYQVEESSAIIDAVAEISPAVVSITSNVDVTSMFGVYTQQTGGTGFIITSDGLVVTNKHVVGDEEAEYSVITADGVSYPAEVLSLDPINDLAVLRVEADNLPIVELGDSESLQIGQTVIAIGNALNEYQNTVTTGVISAVNRSIVAGDMTGNSEELENMIQTDAAINPGNSGGPLVDLSGRVVGINTAIDVEAANIGFAIPINQAKSAIESVIANGRIIRPRLGIRFIPVTPELAAINQMEIKQGALIYGDNVNLGVIPGGPADKAGLRVNDVILSIDGEEITENRSLTSILQQFQPGDEVEIEYYRAGDKSMTKVILDELK